MKQVAALLLFGECHRVGNIWDAASPVGNKLRYLRSLIAKQLEDLVRLAGRKGSLEDLDESAGRTAPIVDLQVPSGGHDSARQRIY